MERLQSECYKQRLSAATITQVTGETRHHQIYTIEIIFGNYHEIDPNALLQCQSLHSLTMISCQLQRISSLSSVRDTLVHLCLINQNLTRIEGLNLPSLQELYLQQNKIQVIEGLQYCRKLQILWLSSNQISQIQNLSYCTDLRELALEDNFIQYLSSDDKDTIDAGLGMLVNIQCLKFAKNHIYRIEDLNLLEKFIHLKHVSFSDDHFGSNPIVSHPAYHSYLITALPNLLSLDGCNISHKEKGWSQEFFLSQSLAFNTKVAKLQSAYIYQTKQLSIEKEKLNKANTEIKEEMTKSLKDLEDCIRSGQYQIQQERQRQIQLQSDRNQIFHAAVQNLNKQFKDLITEQLDSQLQLLQEEEILFESAETALMRINEHMKLLIESEEKMKKHIHFQYVPSHTIDFQLLDKKFNVTVNSIQFNLLTLHHIQDPKNSVEITFNTFSDDATNGDIYFYSFLNNIEEVQFLWSLTSFHVSDSNHAIPPFILYDNPEVAMEIEKSLSSRSDFQILLVCQTQSMECSNLSEIQVADENLSNQKLVSIALDHSNNHGELAKIQLGKLGYCFVLPSFHSTQHLPMFHPSYIALIGPKLFTEACEDINNIDLPVETTAQLEKFKDCLENESISMYTALYKDFEPSVLANTLDQCYDTLQLQLQVQRYESAIHKELAKQMRLLDQFE